MQTLALNMWHMWTNHPLSKFSEPKESLQKPLLRGLVSGDLAQAHAEGLGQGAHF